MNNTDLAKELCRLAKQLASATSEKNLQGYFLKALASLNEAEANLSIVAEEMPYRSADDTTPEMQQNRKEAIKEITKDATDMIRMLSRLVDVKESYFDKKG